MSAHPKTSREASSSVGPQYHAAAPNISAVSASIMGWRNDSGVLQVRHFAPSASQLTMGTFSYHDNSRRQISQADAGNTIDFPIGSR